MQAMVFTGLFTWALKQSGTMILILWLWWTGSDESRPSHHLHETRNKWTSAAE